MVIKNNFHRPSQGQTLIVGIVIALVAVGLIVGGLYLYLESKMPKIEIAEKMTEEEEAPPEGELLKPTGPIDCGTDFDCFIEASRDCNPAKITHTLGPLNIFGMLQTTTSSLEIKGLEADKCVLYTRTEKIDLKFSEEAIQGLLASGLTHEEIQQKEQETNEQYDTFEGADGTCKFAPNDLTAMLDRWKAGQFSSEDWAVAECEGVMFSQ